MAFFSVLPVIVDHAQCGTADSTNFVVLFKGTFAGAGGDPDLRVTGSGGDVTQSDADDINFFSDAGATTKLKWEIEKYDPTTGEIVAWVKVATLDHVTDTVFYMGYGDAGITTFQGDINGTWSSDFELVSHLNSSLADSTSNARTLTASGGNTNYVTGQMANGYKTANPGTDYLTRSDTGFPAGASARTISWWVKWTSNAYNAYIMFYGTFGTDQNPGFFHSWAGTPTLYFTSFPNDLSVAFTPTLNQWYHIVGTYDGTTAKIFIDGTQVASAARSWNTLLGGTFYLASSPFGQMELAFDEVHIVNVKREQSWITSEYNNQKTGSNFLSFGSPPASGVVPQIVRHLMQQGVM